MENEQVVNEAEEKTIVKPEITLEPEVMLRRDARDEIKETYADIIPELFDCEFIYIRKVNNHLEIGPANIEFVQ